MLMSEQVDSLLPAAVAHLMDSPEVNEAAWHIRAEASDLSHSLSRGW